MIKRTILSSLLTLIIFQIIILGCSKKNSFDAESYKKEIEDWQLKRARGLQSENGWLTLCGLFWLKEGENKFGTDSSNAIVFPSGKAPKFAGIIYLSKGSLRLTAQRGTGITYNDSIVTDIIINSDNAGKSKPTVLKLGSLTFQTIKRGDKYGVRVKDKDNPDRLNFKGLNFYDIDPKWCIEATFEPYNPPKPIEIATVINTVEKDTIDGAVVFEVDGKTYRLDANIERGSNPELYIMFSDETSGKETYGNGRQLSVSMPVNNKVVLDFNKAYNWPCAYTDYATCPIPPRQNHMDIRVEAGEKKYKEGHE